MPRHKTCKTRKRVSSSPSSSSSSSSSSIVINYRLKRAVSARKRVCATPTSVPACKLMIRMEGSGSGSGSGLGSKSHMKSLECEKICNGKDGLSARKVGATLWEINDLQSSNGGVGEDGGEVKKVKNGVNESFDDKIMGKLFDSEHDLFMDQHFHSRVCEKNDRSKQGPHRRRCSATSQKLQITQYITGGLDTMGKNNSLEVTSHVPARLKDVSNTLIASKELAKVLFRILSQDEQQSSELTLVSALKVELDRARVQLGQLIRDHRFNSKQSGALMSRFLEEKAGWKRRDKERIREVEIERKLRRQAERLNKKLGAELGDTRAQLSRVMKELENERRSKEILEQTCDELARGIGEERVEVEELKKESEKVREEVEKERQMLQLADVLREERVQMKLTEARYEFEEKNSALERLRSELETYLKGETCRESQVLSQINGGKGFIVEGNDCCESELHSIELNMDNGNKYYNWSFACDGPNAGDSRRPSIDEVFKGRKSLSEKIQWETICLQRNTSDGMSSCQDRTSPAMSKGESSSRLREVHSVILQDLASPRDKIEGQCDASKS